jgi:prolipoprotein diacylglyceryltransferase
VFPQFTITGYGAFQVLALLAFFCGMIFHLGAAVRAQALDLRTAERRLYWHASLLTLLYVFCNVVAAKVLFDLRQSGAEGAEIDWRNYFRLEHYTDGGFWGWPIAFLPLALLYPFVFRLDRVLTLRAMALTLPAVLMLQKAACFCAGFCTGVPTDLPWAMVFPEGSQCPTPGVPVHPVPLYDAVFAFAMYSLVLLPMDRGPATRAFLFPTFVGLYGLNRLLTELFRPEFAGSLSLRQWLAAGAVLAFALLLIAGRRYWLSLLRATADVK